MVVSSLSKIVNILCRHFGVADSLLNFIFPALYPHLRPPKPIFQLITPFREKGEGREASRPNTCVRCPIVIEDGVCVCVNVFVCVRALCERVYMRMCMYVESVCERVCVCERSLCLYVRMCVCGECVCEHVCVRERSLCVYMRIVCVWCVCERVCVHEHFL